MGPESLFSSADEGTATWPLAVPVRSSVSLYATYDPRAPVWLATLLSLCLLSDPELEEGADLQLSAEQACFVFSQTLLVDFVKFFVFYSW